MRILLALCLSGCSVFKPVTDESRYYVLTDLPGKAPRALGAPLVGLERIELPEYLNRPELVARLGNNQLKIYENERWGEPIKDGIGRTLRRDLAVMLGAERIDEPPWSTDGPPALVVEVELRRFERTGEHAVELEATWLLRDGKSGKTLVTHTSTLRQRIEGSGTSVTVQALSQLLASLSSEIAETVRARR